MTSEGSLPSHLPSRREPGKQKPRLKVPISSTEVGIIFFSINLFYLFIYLFLAALGFHCCARAFSSCGEQGLLFIAVSRLLIVVASLVVEYGL